MLGSNLTPNLLSITQFIGLKLFQIVPKQNKAPCQKMANISALSQPLIHPEIQRTENAGIYQTSKSNEIINRSTIGVTAVDIFILIRERFYDEYLQIDSATAAASVLRCSWGALGTCVSVSREHSWFCALLPGRAWDREHGLLFWRVVFCPCNYPGSGDISSRGEMSFSKVRRYFPSSGCV